MERNLNKKALVALGLIFFLFVMIPSAAFSWNQATHAYIAERLGARFGYENLNEIFGSTAPDLFNFIFDPTLCVGWISDQTQGADPDSVMKVWEAASGRSERAMAYGFVSHNQSWGADFTAHISAQSLENHDEGYVIAKARLLLDTPCPDDSGQTFGEVFESLGMDPDEALMVAHLITEDAVDIMLRNDMAPFLGWKLAVAARSGTKRLSSLLVEAFAADYADHCFGGNHSTAAQVLTTAAKEHGMNMIFLGRAISHPKPLAVRLLAKQVVGVLPGFLGHSLPVPDWEAVKIMKEAIHSSMKICHDYRKEIEATIELVGKNLEDHGIACEGVKIPKKGD